MYCCYCRKGFQGSTFSIFHFSVLPICGKTSRTLGSLCKGTTNSRPTSEDNPTVHHPSGTHGHPLRRSLKAANPCLQSLMLTWAHLRTPVVIQGLPVLAYSCLLSVSYLFIHYCTISLFIIALFVTYLHHILYSYIHPHPCIDPDNDIELVTDQSLLSLTSLAACTPGYSWEFILHQISTQVSDQVFLNFFIGFLSHAN